MPRKARAVLRRKMAQAWQHQARTVEIMIDMSELFKEAHPQHSEFMQAIAQNAYLTMDWIKDVSIQCWGFWPASIDSWLK